MDSFRYRGTYQLVVNSDCIVKTNVLCPEQFQEAKELLGKEHTKVGRYEPKKHLQYLLANNSLANPSNPMLVCGIRNVMSNHRCIVYTATNVSPDLPPPYAVAGEEHHRSQRPYYIMAEDITGKLALKEYLPSEEPLEKFRWLFSGVPVLWDDHSSEEIFRMILTEAADHSHIYYLPRGNHPEATDQTRNAWKQMHDVFIETLYAPLDVAFKALHTTATERQ
ncbi:hypothetical protein FJZ31_34125 [Candidatus Poribacteria bacterium]|nr:hypothetical protein [Candidatus Poribacteria bacterium]